MKQKQRSDKRGVRLPTAVEKALMKLRRLNIQLQKDIVVYKNMSRIEYSCGVAREDLGLCVSK